ncbi:MAG: class I SAM-dependent methyltransferase [Gemmataceae bacterium]|nr:class I SAM-dependent methyltransferase [Gemmataceae bacterium]
MAVAAVTRNYWPDGKCAKAFWSQQEVRPYRRLLRDTLDWCSPAAAERWLDLGCGGGPLTRGLWDRSGGAVAEVVGLDCAAVNERAYARLRAELTPPPRGQVRFVCHDFSGGLGPLPDGSFDHAVSGLSITYAESYSEAEGRWTTAAYDRILAEVFRVLRPGGRFVFSVNVPEPAWWRVAAGSLGALVASGRPLRFLKRSARMMRYGGWLKREARAGRFHYLPAAEVAARLTAAGYAGVEYRVSYAGQAFVFRAVKPRAN